MQREELCNLVYEIQKLGCEMQSVEVKSAHVGCPTRLYDSLSWFSNQDGGGIIVFGVDEKSGFDVVGVYDPQDLMHKASEQCKQMQAAGLPAPRFENKRGAFVVTLGNGRTATDNDSPKSGDIEKDLLGFCEIPRTREEIANFTGLTQYYVIKTIVTPLTQRGKLKMTIPDKPRSKNQKYVSV